MLRFTLSIAVVLLFSMPLFTQNWTTHCGNNERNGRSAQPGPQSVGSPLWTVNSAIPTSLGMTIYSFGDYFITPRVDFSPYNARIECRDLKTGELVWTSAEIGDESILYAMGFNEDAVYAHDYHSGYFYALNAADGTVVWVSEDPSYTFAPMDGVIYTCERNLIINGKLGSANASTICLDKENGEIVWTNANLYAITPNETKASHGNHLWVRQVLLHGITLTAHINP